MDDKIVVTNSAIIINNYEMGDCKKLENNFKVSEPMNQSFYRYYFMGMYYDEANKRLYLPRGIDIWYVENLFGETANILINKYDKYHSYSDAMIKYLPKDDVQKEALRFMLGKGKYSKNEAKSQLSVNLNTGKGKTYITIASLIYLGIRGIVITTVSGWLEQWKDRTLEYTDIKEKDICIVSGSNNIYRLMRMPDTKLGRYKLFLVTHSTLRNYASENGWDKVGELFKKLKIGIKIFDEAHLDFNNMCMIDYFTNTYKTYYLTATPNKSNDQENRIYHTSFKNIPSIELFNAETDPHTSYVAIFFNSKPSPQQISYCKSKKYGIDRNKYIGYVVNQNNFTKIFTVIIDLVMRLAPSDDDKVLIYIGTNDSILIVQQWIIENYPEFKDKIGIYTSIIDAKEKKKALNKKFILSTTKSAGAAVDISGLKVTLCLAEPYKSEVIAKQSLGRTRNDNTYYIEVVDTAFEQCRRFYYKKLPIFEKYATDCSLVKLNQAELDNRYDKIIADRLSKLNKIPLLLFSQVNTKNRLFSKVDGKPRLFTKI